jgi:exonuclease SbcD
MSDPIRMLHFADLHVGMENYGRLDPATGTSSRVRDFLERLDEVIDHALMHQADLAVFAGDAFKNREPDPTQQREFAQRIKRLADQVPTLLLVGNHDMPGMAVKASAVDIFQALAVPGVIVGHKSGWQEVATRRGPVFLAWMPYPMRNRLLAREENQSKTIDELELALRQTVSDILSELAQEAEQHAMPRVLAGHFSVSEAKLGSERTVMLGRDVAVTTSTLADPAWDRRAGPHPSPSNLIQGRRHRCTAARSTIDFGESTSPRVSAGWNSSAGAGIHPVRARPFRPADRCRRAGPHGAVVRRFAAEADGAVGVQVQLRRSSRRRSGKRRCIGAGQGGQRERRARGGNRRALGDWREALMPSSSCRLL